MKDIVITNPDTDAFGESCITLANAGGEPVSYVPLLIGNGPYDGTPEGWNDDLRPDPRGGARQPTRRGQRQDQVPRR